MAEKRQKELSRPISMAFILAAGIALLAAVPACAAIPQAERDALIAIYESTGGPSWANREHWRNEGDTGFNDPGTEDTWYGVWVDGDTVLGLYLGDNGLAGALPDVFASLPNLRELDLGGNALAGGLPASLGGLSHLSYLGAAGNRLEGSLPAWLGGLSQLQQLYLGWNRFQGPIAAEIGSLGQLQVLALEGNGLSGGIPAWMGNLSSLRALDLTENPLQGTIPASLGNLSNLEWLALGLTRLTGEIPAELGNLAQLRDLQLYGNSLAGNIPPAMGGLAQLETLNVGYNLLEGSIPVEIGALANLKRLYLDGNRFAGAIPGHLGSLAALEELNLRENQFTGPPPASLGSLANLRYLDLSWNALEGALPDWVASLPQLETLALSGCGLSGTLPPQWSQLSHLSRLYLDHNALVGEVPPAWVGLASLSQLDLSANLLTGPLPTFLPSLPALTEVGLGANAFSGIIPPSYGSCPNLTHLDLYQNQLAGTIPAQLGALHNLDYLDLGGNDLEGGVPAELFGLSNLGFLSLWGNRLSGSLPVGLVNLASLWYLDLSQNRFSGAIPAEWGEIRTLQSLRIACNQLGGPIPAALADLANLDDEWGLDLRFNALYTSDGALRAFLNSKQDGGDWESTQTVPPTGVTAVPGPDGTIAVSWTPIAYTWDSGAYVVSQSKVQGGPYAECGRTEWKDAGALVVSGLEHDTPYFLVVHTVTEAHECNQSVLVSEPSPEVASVSGCIMSCGATAAPSEGHAPLTVAFAALVDTTCQAYPQYLWTFGDGSSAPGASGEHIYPWQGTYGWTLTVTLPGLATCESRTGTITVLPPLAEVMGTVSVGSCCKSSLVDGPGVAGMVTLKDASGQSAGVAPLEGGAFHFSGLTPGSGYTAEATLIYRDPIPYDATDGLFGCPGPAGGALTKTVTLAVPGITLYEGPNDLPLRFDPPLILLHGALDCYQKWYYGGADPTSPGWNSWDDYARRAGRICFTPNYSWLPDSSWERRAEQVLDQIRQDLAGLSTSGAFPYALVGHDMGGLVARVLAGGSLGSDPVVQEAGGIFLLGAPNSGSNLLLGGGGGTSLSEDTVVGSFNEVYPDFGPHGWKVYAIGGDRGWWGTQTGDGRVSVYSAFNITRLYCYRPGPGITRCEPYPSCTFDSESGHVFPYRHGELGGPTSAQEILGGIILPAWVPRAAPESRPPVPESPGGGIIWGTLGRTVGTAKGSAQGRAASSAFDFTISPCEGMGVVALVTLGSADFEVVGPSGLVEGSGTSVTSGEGERGFEFVREDPEPGPWQLRILPGPSGVSYRTTAVENSLFGISGAVLWDAVFPGEGAPVVVEADGVLEGVAFNRVEAVLSDPAGAPIQTVELLDDGLHDDGAAGDLVFGGTLTAPQSAGSYPVAFRATGTFQGYPFERADSDSLGVFVPKQYFTGAFSESALDTDGSGKFDALRFTAPLAVKEAGYYTVEADLLDSEYNFLDHASGYLSAAGAGIISPALTFSLLGATCSQFSGPFQVVNLSAAQGDTFDLIDYWPEWVQTAAYNGATFDCRPGTPGPALSTVFPDQGVQGQPMEISVSGHGFQPDSVLSLGEGISVEYVQFVRESLLQAWVTLAPGAVPGFRAVTVTNSNGASASLPGAFEVKENHPPSVRIQMPAAGSIVQGEVEVSVIATDDVRVELVVLQVDGAPVGEIADFPFRFDWYTWGFPDGPHTLRAVAYDDSGLPGFSPEVPVILNNLGPPGDCNGDGTVSIGELQKAINMFLGTLAPPECRADCDGDGAVSIGELQKVINAFLGYASACF